MKPTSSSSLNHQPNFTTKHSHGFHQFTIQSNPHQTEHLCVHHNPWLFLLCARSSLPKTTSPSLTIPTIQQEITTAQLQFVIAMASPDRPSGLSDCQSTCKIINFSHQFAWNTQALYLGTHELHCRRCPARARARPAFSGATHCTQPTPNLQNPHLLPSSIISLLRRNKKQKKRRETGLKMRRRERRIEEESCEKKRKEAEKLR